jgi:hypothetical protein
MSFATFGAMPRRIAAIGVALVLGGCGKVTFGPLDDAEPGPADVGPMDAEPPLDIGPPPDMGMPDQGPPPDGGDCMLVQAPTYPAAMMGTSWPFLARTEAEKKVVYQRIFWTDAYDVFNGCTAANCHGYGDDGLESSAPLIPFDMAAVDGSYQAGIDQIWERILESDDVNKVGRMYAHHTTSASGILEARNEDAWDPNNPAFQGKIAFVDRVIKNARDCHAFGWIKSNEAMICGPGGGGDTGDLDAGADAGGGQSDCLCAAPFEQMRANLDWSWATMNCRDPTL